MTTTTYKGYTIKTVGISRHIYRPGQIMPQRLAPQNTPLVTVDSTDLVSIGYAPGYAQSMAAAKRWINEDIKERLLENNRYYA